MVGIVEKHEDGEVERLLDSVGAALHGLSDLGISPDKVLGLAKARQSRGIPISIFNPHLGALESIVKYMCEELLLDYGSIASILGRNEGPIGLTCRRAKKKLKSRLDKSSETSKTKKVLGVDSKRGQQSIPFDVLRANPKNNLSIFESLAYHLMKNGHDWHEIARIMHRHDKTVWTVLDRAKRKMGGRGQR